MVFPNIQIPPLLISCMNIGDIVKDKKSIYDGMGVVTGLLHKEAKDVYIESENKTVDKLNPESDPHSEVIKIVFINNLEMKIPTWWMMEEEQLKKAINSVGIKEYYYPIDRLSYIKDGLINGVILRVEGVADPFSYVDGAYAFEISKLDNNISHSKSERVEDYEKITKNISTMVGILEGLKWAKDSGQEWGIQVVLTNKKTASQLNGEYHINDKTTTVIANEIKEIASSFPKVEYITIPKGDNKNLQKTAVEAYEKESFRDYKIDRVVDEEYIVDGIFSVNLDQNSCTCDQNGVCDHIKAVQESKPEKV
jgi:ssRNA-specific RNase YbeY (16S rRNA maturation enzyme)